MTVTTTINGIPTVTNRGIINSFGNTPQAKDDLFTAALTEDSLSVILDVMANDGAGKGKSLWSLDDGISAGGIRPTDLLAQDAINAVQYSARGAEIRITAEGKVSYTMTAASTANFQSLGEGEIGTDTFTYAIRMGNGTLSWATATVQITGTNDVATLTSATAALTETNAVLSTGGTLVLADLDATDATVTPQTTATAYGSFTINAAGVWSYTTSSALDALNANQVVTEVFNVATTDGGSASVTVNITGTNDAAVISGTSSGVVLEATSANTGTPTATGDLLATDPDNTHDAFQAVGSPTVTASGYGSYTVTAAGVWTYALNNANAAVNALNNGQTLSDSFTVYSEDGTAKVVNITINGATDAGAVNDILYVTRADSNTAFTGVVNKFSLSDLTANDIGGFAITGISGSATGTFGATAATNGNGSIRIVGDNLELYTNNTNQDTFYYRNSNGDVGQVTYNVFNTGNSGEPFNLSTLTYQASYIDARGGNDTLIGGAGIDYLLGGAGNETIVGGIGNENLTGGAGADTFKYHSINDRIDTITDFNKGEGDKLDLKDLLGSIGATPANAFSGGYVQFVDSNGAAAGGDTRVMIDADGAAGSGAAVLLVTLTNVILTQLDTTNYIL